MSVDSYKYLPRSMREMYEGTPETREPHAWTPLEKPASQARFALMTSAGIYLKDQQEPFDVERERQEPSWGDPTYRVIPADVRQEQLGHTHLHINGEDILEDVNVVLPIRAFRSLEAEGAIGSLSDEHYSFMGFQDRRLKDWREQQGPEVAKRLQERGVDVLLLAPA
ncbi:MAG: glycine/sarcosine/betaine reductase selenoprotein B family protein [Dehalococcoidia bacterium]|nr:glycine/sarcosine/betaine reductase selenoprotein B family protein [Dehalococcoidia bacterium]